PDGCGGAIDCGACPSGQACNSSGTACVCAPRTTCPAGQECGTAPDGCGGTIECGFCTLRGTFNVNNQCVCNPLTACPAGYSCGLAPDECDGVLDCGTCPAPELCAGDGDNHCGRPAPECDLGGNTLACLHTRDKVSDPLSVR